MGTLQNKHGPLCVEPVSSELAPSKIEGPAKVVAAVATGSGLLHEAEKLMEAHVQRIYRGNLPQAPREGWTLRDHDYDHAVRWWRGDGWWTIEHAMLWPSREMAEAYAAGFRGWRPTVEFARHQNASDEPRPLGAVGSGRLFERPAPDSK